VSRNPRHLLVVAPWLRRPAQRLVLPDWLAITIGPVIVAWRRLDDAELAHELAHVRQWRRYGLAFIWRYLRASAAAERAGRDRYRDNRFEREARAASRRVGRQARSRWTE
jgi:hypothetical protein